MKVIKKRITVDAVRLNPDEDDKAEILSWSTKERPIVIVVDENNDSIYAEIKTLEGTMRADKGDWIIKGIKGEVYPCKDNIFSESYEIIINQNEKILESIHQKEMCRL